MTWLNMQRKAKTEDMQNTQCVVSILFFMYDV